MVEEKKNVKKSLDEYIPVLDLLMNKQQRLEVILSLKETDKPLMYSIKGKKSTKTVFISEMLQEVIKEYSAEIQVKQGEIIEVAIVDFLVNHGYEERVKGILNV